MSENEFNKIFAKRLQHYLDVYEISQAELARRLGSRIPDTPPDVPEHDRRGSPEGNYSHKRTFRAVCLIYYRLTTDLLQIVGHMLPKSVK